MKDNGDDGPPGRRISAHSTICRHKGRCCRELKDCELEVLTINKNKRTLVIKNGVCSDLDKETGRCTVYDDRPLMCATWLCAYCNPIEERD